MIIDGIGEKRGKRRTLNRIRYRINQLLVDVPHGGRIVMYIQIALFLVIILNSILVILITVPVIRDSMGWFLNDIISVTLLIFTIEYLLRLWSCTGADTIRERMKDRLRYIIEPYAIIDLISILPFFLPFFVPSDLSVIRLVRLLSIFKFMRYARHSESLNLLTRIFFRKREIFAIMGFFFVFILLFSSTIMYIIENHAQPDKFSSIPAAMWWAMMTVTTVGYGDIIPITPFGKIIGSIFTILGVMILALPSAILASGFIEERTKKEENGTDKRYITREKVRDEIDLIERIHLLRTEGVISKEKEHEYIIRIQSQNSDHHQKQMADENKNGRE